MNCSDTSVYSWLHRLTALPGLHQPKPGHKVDQTNLKILSSMLKMITDEAAAPHSLKTHIEQCISCKEYCYGNKEFNEVRNKSGVKKVWAEEELTLIVPFMAMVAAKVGVKNKEAIANATSEKFHMLLNLGLFEPNKHSFSGFGPHVFRRISTDNIHNCELADTYNKIFQHYQMTPQVRSETTDSTTNQPDIFKPQPLAFGRMRIQSFSRREAIWYLKASVLPTPR